MTAFKKWMNQLFPLRSSSFQKWLGPKITGEVEATTSLTPHHSLTMFSEWETSCCGQCVSWGFANQKRLWALRHKSMQKGPLSFTPAHKYKIKTVIHKVGKKSLTKIYLFQLHNLLFSYISPSLTFSTQTTPVPTLPTNLCSPKRNAQALTCLHTITSLRSISSSRRKLSRALLLSNPQGSSV